MEYKKILSNIESLDRNKKVYLYSNFDKIAKILKFSSIEDIEEETNENRQKKFENNLKLLKDKLDEEIFHIELTDPTNPNPKETALQKVKESQDWDEELWNEFLKKENSQTELISQNENKILKEKEIKDQKEYSTITIKDIIENRADLSVFPENFFVKNENGEKESLQIENGIFSLPVKQSGTNVYLTIDTDLLNQVLLRMDVISQLTQDVSQPKNLREEIFNKFYKSEFTQKIDLKLRHSEKNRLKYYEEHGVDPKKTENYQMSINNFNFYNNLSEDFTSTCLKYQINKMISPKTYDEIIYQAKILLENEKKIRKDQKITEISPFINQSNSKNLYDLFEKNNILNSIIQQILSKYPENNEKNLIFVLKNIMTMDFVGQIFTNKEYDSLYKEQSEVIQHTRGAGKSALRKNIYCRNCGKFRNGGELPSTLNWNDISQDSSIWNYWEIDRKGKLVYKFPQETESEFTDIPISEESFGTIEKDITSPITKEKITKGCLLGADGFLNCDPVPNLHLSEEIESEIGTPRDPVLFEGNPLFFVYEGNKIPIFADPDYINNNYNRVIQYLLQNEKFITESIYPDYNPLTIDQAKKIIQQYIEFTGEFNCKTFVSKEDARVKNKKTLVNNIEITANKLKPLMVNVLMHLGKTQEEAEHQMINDIVAFTIPDINNKQFVSGSGIYKRNLPSFGDNLNKLAKKDKIAFLNIFPQALDLLEPYANEINLVSRSYAYGTLAFSEAQDELTRKIRELCLKLYPLGLNESQTKEILSFGIRNIVNKIDKSKKSVDEDDTSLEIKNKAISLFQQFLGEKSILFPRIDEFFEKKSKEIKNLPTDQQREALENLLAQTEELEKIPTEGFLESRVLPGYGLSDSELANLVSSILHVTNVLPPNDLGIYVGVKGETLGKIKKEIPQQGGAYFETESKNVNRIYWIIKEILYNEFKNFNTLFNENPQIAIDQLYELVLRKYSNKFEFIGIESIPNLISKALFEKSKEKGMLIQEDLQINQNIYEALLNQTPFESSIFDNLWHLNKWFDIIRGSDIDLNSSIESLRQEKRKQFGNIDIDEETDKIITEASLKRDWIRLLQANPDFLDDKDCKKREFYLKFVTNSVDNFFIEVGERKGNYILKNNQYHRVGDGMGNFICKDSAYKDFLKKVEGLDKEIYLNFLKDSFINADPILQKFLTDYENEFKGSSHPDPAIDKKIRQISYKTSFMRKLPSKPKDIPGLFDTAYADLSIEDLLEIYPQSENEIDDNYAQRISMIKADRDAFIQKQTNPDWDDFEKILCMPYEVQKKIMQMKNKDMRLFLNPETRRIIAYLVLNQLQNPANLSKISERKIGVLRLNVKYGGLMNYNNTLMEFSSTSSLKDLPLLYHIVGKDASKIFPHLSGKSLETTQGVKETREKNIQNLAQEYKTDILKAIQSKNNKQATNKNWYKTSANIKESNYKYVIILHKMDPYVLARNASIISKEMKYKQMTMPKSFIVPFEKFGSLLKVYQFNLQNKDFETLLVNKKLADLLSKIGLVNWSQI